VCVFECVFCACASTFIVPARVCACVCMCVLVTPSIKLYYEKSMCKALTGPLDNQIASCSVHRHQASSSCVVSSNIMPYTRLHFHMHSKALFTCRDNSLSCVGLITI
jgi:hypothetical protein